MSCFIICEFILDTTITEGVDRGYAYPLSRPSSPSTHPFSHFSHLASPFSLPFFLPPLLHSPAPSLLFPGLPIHCPSSHNRRTDRTKKNNIHSATSYLIFQYLQYWYNQYFLESSSICNTGITSIFQNLPVSAILIFWQ